MSIVNPFTVGAGRYLAAAGIGGATAYCLPTLIEWDIVPGFTSKTYDLAEKQIRYDNYTTGFVYQSFQTSAVSLLRDDTKRDEWNNIPYCSSSAHTSVFSYSFCEGFFAFLHSQTSQLVP